MKIILNKDYVIKKIIEEKIFVSEDEVDIILNGVFHIEKIKREISLFLNRSIL
tara:strand:+ start:901 stop:1059 length:159 start_codon:yes stop_codon:yes gene_type:complete